MTFCVFCNKLFKRTDKQFCSALHGADYYWICKTCFDAEKSDIEISGTNNLPELVEIYRKNDS